MENFTVRFLRGQKQDGKQKYIKVSKSHQNVIYMIPLMWIWQEDRSHTHSWDA